MSRALVEAVRSTRNAASNKGIAKPGVCGDVPGRDVPLDPENPDRSKGQRLQIISVILIDRVRIQTSGKMQQATLEPVDEDPWNLLRTLAWSRDVYYCGIAS
jgi:hypothetical protein